MSIPMTCSCGFTGQPLFEKLSLESDNRVIVIVRCPECRDVRDIAYTASDAWIAGDRDDPQGP
jgi:hypothetical protein